MQASHELNQSVKPAAALPPATEVGAVTLKTARLEQQLEFYTQVIGLQPLHKEEVAGQVVLGAGRRPIIVLQETPEAHRPPPNATGLYHAAILFPDRHALAVKMAQIETLRVPYGYADHLVSEAFYLSDPEGNGLELYWDRPREAWVWEGQRVRMASEPIDLVGFFGELKEGEAAQSGPEAAVGTQLGHIHLRIANIELAEKFYHDLLGFDVTARWPGALFLSAGGYHHHLGMNTWESRGGKPPELLSTGLAEFSLALPDPAELDRLAQRLAASEVEVERDGGDALIRDPFQNQIRLIVKERLTVSDL
ncbi:MAG: VOC family protein [Chloroflexi bacterium]|nr:VOC family protein [Chloroflexota bacterium]